MDVSFIALARFAETKALEDPQYRKRLAKSGKALPLDARALPDAALLERLAKFGILLDRARLRELCVKHVSAEELSNEFSGVWQPKAGGKDLESDWFWLALMVLWERWFPDIPNFEQIDDRMQQGYHLEDPVAVCQVWLGVWTSMLSLMERAGIASICEFDKRFRGSEMVCNWVQDFDEQLMEAARTDRRYHQTRVEYCREFLGRFSGENQLVTENMRRAMAESIFEQGDAARSDALYEQWLGDDPQWGWGWIGWADHYLFGPERLRDKARARALLETGLAVPDVRARDDIRERLRENGLAAE